MLLYDFLHYLCSEIWCPKLRLWVKREPGVNPGQTVLLCAPDGIPHLTTALSPCNKGKRGKDRQQKG